MRDMKNGRKDWILSVIERKFYATNTIFKHFPGHLHSRKLTRQANFCVTRFSYNNLPSTLSPGNFFKKLALIVLKGSSFLIYEKMSI